MLLTAIRVKALSIRFAAVMAAFPVIIPMTEVLRSGVECRPRLDAAIPAVVVLAAAGSGAGAAAAGAVPRQAFDMQLAVFPNAIRI